MFLPEQWPSYFSRASGAEVWDLDGNRFIDMSYSGIGSCILGYADPDVNAAVAQAVAMGSMCTLNSPEEVELADLLCEIHPWAEMVRFARCGGEALAVSVRIARARTRRDKVLFCGYHGWSDWYLAANLAEDSALTGHLLPGLEPAGVPRGLAGTAIPFRYNDTGGFLQAFDETVAAVVMEPMRFVEPAPGFLETIREETARLKAVLIFDEVTAGWRLNSGGLHLLRGVMPDVAVFAKAISNGYPMAAVIGTEEVMEAAQETFISSTYWTERIGPTAALAAIRKHQRLGVPAHLTRIGTDVQQVWNAAARTNGIDITIGGIPPLGHFTFNCPHPQAVRTLFTQLMLDRGFLATPSFYAMYAHQSKHVEAYADALDETFTQIAQAIAGGTVDRQLRGPVAHSGFTRLT
jgi:glutamate-1-semialdehyde aminotransferase